MTNERDNFKARAREHQIKFRTETLKVKDYDKYETWLKRTDGERGLNFYNDFAIFGEVKSRYPKYKQGLYSDILRSEHIPFNLFIPLKEEKVFCRNVMNEFLNNAIKTVDDVKIEYAPSPAEKYLSDRTSFDAYIEFTHKDGGKGIIGIEVKYTEKEYPLKSGSKEETDIKNEKSPYFRITGECSIYKTTANNLLITDRFRQIWRNQLLGESILLKDKNQFKHFTSVTIFPQDNLHFVETSKAYIDLLEIKERFLPVTYEQFFTHLKHHSPSEKFSKWVDYLNERYIVPTEKKDGR